jgi:hypothetical protein
VFASPSCALRLRSSFLLSHYVCNNFRTVLHTCPLERYNIVLVYTSLEMSSMHSVTREMKLNSHSLKGGIERQLGGQEGGRENHASSLLHPLNMHIKPRSLSKNDHTTAPVFEGEDLNAPLCLRGSGQPSNSAIAPSLVPSACVGYRICSWGKVFVYTFHTGTWWDDR